MSLHDWGCGEPFRYVSGRVKYCDRETDVCGIQKQQPVPGGEKGKEARVEGAGREMRGK